MNIGLLRRLVNSSNIALDKLIKMQLGTPSDITTETVQGKQNAILKSNEEVKNKINLSIGNSSDSGDTTVFGKLNSVNNIVKAEAEDSLRYDEVAVLSKEENVIYRNSGTVEIIAGDRVYPKTVILGSFKTTNSCAISVSFKLNFFSERDAGIYITTKSKPFDSNDIQFNSQKGAILCYGSTEDFIYDGSILHIKLFPNTTYYIHAFYKENDTPYWAKISNILIKKRDFKKEISREKHKIGSVKKSYLVNGELIYLNTPYLPKVENIDGDFTIVNDYSHPSKTNFRAYDFVFVDKEMFAIGIKTDIIKTIKELY